VDYARHFKDGSAAGRAEPSGVEAAANGGAARSFFTARVCVGILEASANQVEVDAGSTALRTGSGTRVASEHEDANLPVLPVHTSRTPSRR
jgi:hypothetical protein